MHAPDAQGWRAQFLTRNGPTNLGIDQAVHPGQLHGKRKGQAVSQAQPQAQD